jgi:hypothetical protein
MDLGKPALCCQQRSVYSCTFGLYVSYSGRGSLHCTMLDPDNMDSMRLCIALLIRLHSKGAIGLACLGEFCSFVAS